MSTTFVLVHGAFGSPAELAPIVPFLEGAGHRVINVDLPIEMPDATLEDYASTIARAIAGATGRRILVVRRRLMSTIALLRYGVV